MNDNCNNLRKIVREHVSLNEEDITIFIMNSLYRIKKYNVDDMTEVDIYDQIIHLYENVDSLLSISKKKMNRKIKFNYCGKYHIVDSKDILVTSNAVKVYLKTTRSYFDTVLIDDIEVLSPIAHIKELLKEIRKGE